MLFYVLAVLIRVVSTRFETIDPSHVKLWDFVGGLSPLIGAIVVILALRRKMKTSLFGTSVTKSILTLAVPFGLFGIVDYKEAIELRCFLSVISPTRGVEKLTNILDIFLEDGVIDTDESSTLVELILDVSAELTGKSFISCPRCGAPLRNEQSEAILSCTWCGAPLFV